MPIYAATTLDELLADQFRERRFHLLLLGGFAASAVLLAAVGVYGVLSQATRERTREIGIRMALGARPADVLVLVMSGGARLAVAGVVLGALAAAALSGALRAMLYRVSPLDPWTFLAAAVLVMGVSTLACYLPARRAARVHPMQTLRAG
jgi:ABC-type antimicrobial peptide transport system permease subunit